MALLTAVRSFLRQHPGNPLAEGLSDRLRNDRRAPLADAPRLLIQGLEDPYYMGIFGYIATALRERTAVHVNVFMARSIQAAIGVGWKEWVLRTYPVTRLLSNQWVRLHKTFVDEIAYRSTSLDHPVGDVADLERARREWKSVRTPRELESLCVDGIQIGDLVIDTYLRFRPSPRIVLDDWFVLYLIWQALRDLRRAREYFRGRRPRVYLTSYTTYIPHGIAVRVALAEGVAVFSFGNFQDFSKRLSLEDPHHPRNTKRYRRDFAALDRQEERLREAEEQLTNRLSGGVDAATAYMTKSAYRDAAADVPDVHGKVGVFLHDFFDSPHVWNNLVFPEFWEWICFTIETLNAAQVSFFIKPHPNQIDLGPGVLADLRAKYPDVTIIPSNVTNRQLVAAGMISAVTVYGTVGHEMGFLGVPTICCADHPHIAFDFCRTAKDLDQYAAFLRESSTFKADPHAMRRQALEFYYMHNLYVPPETMSLRKALLAVYRACHDPKTSVDEVVRAFDDMAAQPGFATFIDELARLLAGGST